MGRLTAMRPRVAGVGARVKAPVDAHGHSRTSEPWRGWYALKRWRDLRLFVFDRDHYRCQCGCGVLGHGPGDLVADHIKAHRGDPVLFWNPANVQALLKPCHDRVKQAEEAAARLGHRP